MTLTPSPCPLVARCAKAARHACLALVLAVWSGGPLEASTGLGPATVQSLQGEPLRATLSLAGQSAEAPIIRLASPASYARLGQTRDPALMSALLRITREPDGRRLLRIETGQPLQAPTLLLILEQGETRRLYRLNLASLDPAGRVQVMGVSPEVGSAGGPSPFTKLTPAPAPAHAASPRTADSAAERLNAPIAPQARPDVLTVAEGADLDALAQSIRPPGATVEQSAAALLRANRSAFTGYPPRPIVGARLQVPSEATVLALSAAQARAVFRALRSEEFLEP